MLRNSLRTVAWNATRPYRLLQALLQLSLVLLIITSLSQAVNYRLETHFRRYNEERASSDVNVFELSKLCRITELARKIYNRLMPCKIIRIPYGFTPMRFHARDSRCYAVPVFPTACWSFPRLIRYPNSFPPEFLLLTPMCLLLHSPL